MTATNVSLARLPGALLTLTGLLLMACLLAAAFFPWPSEVARPLAWALALTLIVVAVLPLWLESRAGTLDLFNLRNWFVLYYAFQFGVWAIVVLATGTDLYLTDYLGAFDRWQGSLLLALAYCILGLLCFHCGYARQAGKLLGRALPGLSPEWGRGRMALLAVLLLAAGVAAFFSIVGSYGGLALWLAHIGDARVEGIWSKGYLYFAACFFPTVPALMYYSEYLRTRNRKYMAISAAAFLTSSAIGFLMGYRTIVVFPLLEAACLHHYLASRIGIRLRTALVVVPATVLLIVYTMYREYALGQFDLVSLLGNSRFWSLAINAFFGRFTGIETVTLAVHRTGDTAPGLGLDSAQYLVTGLIPRSLWEDKIVPLQGFYRTVYGGIDKGASTTFPGEMYWHLRLPGILLSMFAMGVLCRAAYQYLEAHPGRSSVLLYAVALIYVMELIEAPTVGASAFLITFAGMLAAVALVRRPSPLSRPMS